jgi:lipopolysaccharide/colanic/teichoic acid biosynthesis glycosyltransferase
MEEAETFTDVQKDVFLVRPGLISPVTSVKEENEVLEKELKYAWTFGFFTDLKIFFTWLIKKIRGEE